MPVHIACETWAPISSTTVHDAVTPPCRQPGFAHAAALQAYLDPRLLRAGGVATPQLAALAEAASACLQPRPADRRAGPRELSPGEGGTCLLRFLHCTLSCTTVQTLAMHNDNYTATYLTYFFPVCFIHQQTCKGVRAWLLGSPLAGAQALFL